jgi:hypothetical protein
VCAILPASVDTPIFRHDGNYLGEATEPVPPVADPQRVVRAILRCVERPKAGGHRGPGRTTLLLGPFRVPRLYDRLAPHAMHLVALGEETEKGPGNVFEPNPEWNRVSGEWRIDRRRLAFGLAGAFSLAASAAAGLRRVARRRRQGLHRDTMLSRSSAQRQSRHT